MKRCGTEGEANRVAGLDGLRCGQSPHDGEFYVGTSPELGRLGCLEFQAVYEGGASPVTHHCFQDALEEAEASGLEVIGIHRTLPALQFGGRR
jgi:hypothetical protein